MSSSLLLLAPALAGGGLAAEAVLGRRDRRRFPPPGRRVDVGGHALHARMLGSGDPVIVLEAGAGEWSSHWDRLPVQLSELSTVIAYDRAGLGWSDPGPPPRTAETLARELRQLLRVLAPDRPVLLVGHSIGAHVLRTFAHRYPFDLQGLVFVDGYHETLEAELAKAQVPSPAVSPMVLHIFWLAARLGLLRATRYSSLGPAGKDLPIPPSSRELIETLGRSARVLAGMLAEQRALPESDRQVAGLREGIEVPVRVLTAAESLSERGTPSRYPRREFNRVWREVNARLTELSDDAQQVTVEGTDHLIPLRSPRSVLDSVRAVLEAARAARAASAR